jgi:hypothetical protein
MAEPAADLDLEELYARSRGTGDYDDKILGWRYRFARAHARRAVAESQLRRLTALETSGQDVTAAAVHTVELELGDAAGSIAFCAEMLKAAQAAPRPQQTNGGKKP